MPGTSHLVRACRACFLKHSSAHELVCLYQSCRANLLAYNSELHSHKEKKNYDGLPTKYPVQVLEETPSPLVDSGLRSRLTEAAVSLGRLTEASLAKFFSLVHAQATRAVAA
eukprot:scaffold196541_cov17-Tisochrysis_lutea.AAC.2